jgi:hypothetical protein
MNNENNYDSQKMLSNTYDPSIYKHEDGSNRLPTILVSYDYAMAIHGSSIIHGNYTIPDDTNIIIGNYFR